MSNKGAASKMGGSGLLLGGVGIVVAIIAGALLMVRENAQPSTEELSELVSPQKIEEAPLSEQEQAAPSAADSSGDPAPTPASDQPQETPTQQNADNSPADAPAQDAASEEGAAPEDTIASTSQESTIDEVRIDNDGLAVIAGRAEPGAQVDVIVDGDVVAQAQADGSGAFAALGVIEPSDQARVLTLSTDDGSETATVSREEVILAPLPAPAEPKAEAPVDVATAEPEASDSVEPEASDPVEVDAPTVEAADVSPSETAEVVEETVAQTESTTEEEVTQAPEISTQAPTPLVIADTPSAAPEEAPQIALLKSTDEGVALLQTAPEPPSRIVLDIIGYSDSGVVQLSGRASEAASEVRVYLNNRSIATLPVDAAGNWRGNVPDIDTGVYTLRVDAVDNAGDVTSRLETPFKREDPEVLAAATSGASGPVNAVTVQTGDTLWAIARDRYGEGLLYVRVFEANRTSIRNPDLIYPGQVFDLPGE